MALDQDGSGSLVAPILRGELAQPSSLLGRNRKEPMLAALAARDHPTGVELALGTTTTRVTTLASQQIKRALNHRLRALEAVQGPRQGGVQPPKFLAQSGEVSVQLYLVIHYEIQKRKPKNQKK